MEQSAPDPAAPMVLLPAPMLVIMSTNSAACGLLLLRPPPLTILGVGVGSLPPRAGALEVREVLDRGDVEPQKFSLANPLWQCSLQPGQAVKLCQAAARAQ